MATWPLVGWLPGRLVPLGIPLDIGHRTSDIGIGIGIGFDDTMHQTHRFLADRQARGDTESALRRSHAGAGCAIERTSMQRMTAEPCFSVAVIAKCATHWVMQDSTFQARGGDPQNEG
jgi:hypothetical protein